ncbi:MAG: helix-turn-helix domain-containing protein [Lachnospiraceae bacterium]|nr:helix-turn-helix domain-containing protein [Lachnospiraceae bacterium]
MQNNGIAAVPIWRKYSLSVEEAAEYYGIGEKRLRSIALEHRGKGFILEIGSRVRFKRRLFEEYLDMASAV